MKAYPYNKASTEGRRLFRLLDAQFNKGAIDATNHYKTFESYKVQATAKCRVNKISFLFSSNLSGLKRPQIRVESDVEEAWGEFTEQVTELDFTHSNQELPLSYVQPLEDDTLKLLIDAGLYRDERFEELMNKLITNEEFETKAELGVTFLDVAQVHAEESIPVLLIDPVAAVQDDYDPPEQTTIADLVKRSALLVIELHKDGIKTEELVRVSEPEQDQEVFLVEDFRDVVVQKEEEEIEREVDDSIAASSELLDREIDVTDRLKGSLTFDHTSEDDKIRDLKERSWEEEAPTQQTDALDRQNQDESEYSPDGSDTYGSDLDSFGKDLDDYQYKDDGPEL
ncbi:hypothetical protein [Shouchella clausii]|uniref:hypothetical protein n=1 Tax=Shouchella clausii TaxID=79880 RepID=UPI001155036F|nr:hypothetical protein [Shouchella clausii]